MSGNQFQVSRNQLPVSSVRLPGDLRRHFHRKGLAPGDPLSLTTICRVLLRFAVFVYCANYSRFNVPVNLVAAAYAPPVLRAVRTSADRHRLAQVGDDALQVAAKLRAIGQLGQQLLAIRQLLAGEVEINRTLVDLLAHRE